MTVNIKWGLGLESDQARWAIREAKALLDSYRKCIHSLVMFGSFAMGRAGRHSDIDFLVLLKNGQRTKAIRSSLFNLTMCLEGDNNKKSPVKIQLVDFDEKGIERLFELSTPLVHAVRHGEIIWDDGWFKTLLLRPYPKWPTTEGAIEAFTHWIAWMYYRCAVDLKREIRADHGKEGQCTKNGRCSGHFSGDILARLISRMLYVTLPERGFLPLCKPDAISMAQEAYGSQAWRPVAIAVNILRKDRAVYHREFQVMFPFARSLFRECLKICGPSNPEVIETLHHNAEVYKLLRLKLPAKTAPPAKP